MVGWENYPPWVRNIVQVEVNQVKPIRYVDLEEVDWSVVWAEEECVSQEAVQGIAKLHQSFSIEWYYFLVDIMEPSPILKIHQNR
jgi:hypothetical protein